MKKYFIILGMFVMMLMAGTTNVYAAPDGGFVDGVATVYNDVTDATSTIYGDARDVVKTVYPEVRDAVVAIGRGIGVAAEHVYEVLVKKYVVEGVAGLVWILLGAAILIFGFCKINKAISNKEPLTWRIGMNVLYMLIGVAILANTNFNATLMGLINPEWGAINYILDYTRNLIN